MTVELDDLESLTRASYIDLTTTGRKTGEPRIVELSFAVKGNEIVCLAGNGGKVQWYRNLLRDPKVSIRVGNLNLRARAVKRISHPKKLARGILELFRKKYGSAYVRDRYRGTDRAPVRIKVLGRERD
ncbi:MAG: nitroreductase family deazaflavin-dependent oxidoreductase [Deltaproteobacteria bacterium]|nr:nitroreductase family deazaflavin-dependent oxidoreductase [Deltaproteobacteria bacterium]